MEKIEWTGLSGKAMTVFGVLGGFIAHYLGGWDTMMQTLMLFMVVDYLTGLMVAGIFQDSPKSKTGAISSMSGWRGLAKKGTSLLFILLATQLDLLMGTDFIRVGMIFPLIVNETISIIENAGLMGVPVPTVMAEAIELLKKKSEGGKL